MRQSGAYSSTQEIAALTSFARNDNLILSLPLAPPAHHFAALPV